MHLLSVLNKMTLKQICSLDGKIELCSNIVCKMYSLKVWVLWFHKHGSRWTAYSKLSLVSECVNLCVYMVHYNKLGLFKNGIGSETLARGKKNINGRWMNEWMVYIWCLFIHLQPFTLLVWLMKVCVRCSKFCTTIQRNEIN